MTNKCLSTVVVCMPYNFVDNMIGINLFSRYKKVNKDRFIFVELNIDPKVFS